MTKVLQDNAEGLFNKVFQKHSQKMKCANGCSQCCYTDISIFTWEANLIMEWFDQLALEEKKNLQNSWLNNQTNPLACTFLMNDSCSIYPARPIICRTQGMPIEIDGKFDCCPLNFTEGLPEKSDILNVERLNILSSLSQQQFMKAVDDPEYPERISLKQLKQEIINAELLKNLY
jgi:Fe-S-cluster containining protein